MVTSFNFIVVDDDKLVNMFSSLVIRKAFQHANVKTFEDPEQGLEYLIAEYSIANSTMPTVLFLDINMPTMTGWEFLEEFEKLDEKIKNQIKIYILSSSVDERDMEQAAANKYVKAYLTKPVTKEMMFAATSDLDDLAK